MVHFVHLISAAALVSVSSAAPMVPRDGSAIGSEIPVSAPNGIPMSDAPSSSAGSNGYGSMPMASSMPMADSSMMASSMASSMPMATSSVMASSVSMAESMMASSMHMASSMPMASAMPMASSSMMSYGSGSSSWGGGGSGYDSCVQQCAASHAQPSMMWTPSATEAAASGVSSGGSGVTHTVIVAPTQGVLRYIPFSTNASVGDTVSFVWGAGPHTVTQSSALEVCNKTSTPGAFASGVQNKSFVFNQVINNTNPIWFYCGVPGHCQKGMFGGVNIGQADPTGMGSSMPSASMPSSSSSSYMPLSSMMANLTMTQPDMSALWSYTKSKTAGNSYANGWGMSTNCAGMSQDAMMQTAQNVMYMQTLIAANPQAVQGGKFTVNNANNMTIPPDIMVALASASPNSTSSAAAGAASPMASGASISATGTAAAAAASHSSNGAGAVTSSTVVVGLVAVVATFFAL